MRTRLDTRVDAAMHAVMRAHAALLVLDSAYVLSPLPDVTAEIAALVSSSSELAMPRLGPPAPPLLLVDTLDGVKVAQQLIAATGLREDEAWPRLRRVIAASTPALVVDTRAVAHAPAAVDATLAIGQALDSRQARAVVPSPAPARIALVNLGRALQECADCPAMKRELPGRAAVPAAELDQRMNTLLDALAARLHIDIVLKRSALPGVSRQLVLDSDEGVPELTHELLRAYDEAYAPSALQLPYSQTRLQLADANSSQLSEWLARASGRTIELGHCLLNEGSLFIFTPQTTLRAIFDELGRRYDSPGLTTASPSAPAARRRRRANSWRWKRPAWSRRPRWGWRRTRAETLAWASCSIGSSRTAPGAAAASSSSTCSPGSRAARSAPTRRCWSSSPPPDPASWPCCEAAARSPFKPLRCSIGEAVYGNPTRSNIES